MDHAAATGGLTQRSPLAIDSGLTLEEVEFRLRALQVDFWVDVRLRSWGDRWLAVADICGEPEIGLGGSARTALEGALASLGQRAAGAFLTDPALLAATSEIVRQERTPEG